MGISRTVRSVLLGVVAVGFATSADAALIHRFSFTDTKDLVGKAEAVLKGAAKVADGKLVLENGDKTATDAALSYVEFKAPILPASGSVSLVTWFQGKENPGFARILNLGTTSDGAGSAFIYITPRTGDGMGRAAISATDTATKTAVDFEPIDDGKAHCLAVVIDGTAKKIRVYVDGKEVGEKGGTALGENTLDKVKATSNWIGKSSFDNDAGLTGSIDELRVYDNALTAEEVKAISTAGADKLPEAAAK